MRTKPEGEGNKARIEPEENGARGTKGGHETKLDALQNFHGFLKVNVKSRRREEAEERQRDLQRKSRRTPRRNREEKKGSL